MLIALWILNALLALVFLAAGGLKLLKPRAALIDGGMPWAADFPPLTVKAIGALQVLGALGLVLPLLTGIAPLLAPVAALGLAVLMVGAVVVHRRRREPVIPPAVLALLATISAVLGFIVLG